MRKKTSTFLPHVHKAKLLAAVFPVQVGYPQDFLQPEPFSLISEEENMPFVLELQFFLRDSECKTGIISGTELLLCTICLEHSMGRFLTVFFMLVY